MMTDHLLTCRLALVRAVDTADERISVDVVNDRVFGGQPAIIDGGMHFGCDGQELLDLSVQS